MTAASPCGEPGTLWECAVCLHQYDPAVGDPDHGIAPGTAFVDLPSDWRCPDCGVDKSFYAALP